MQLFLNNHFGKQFLALVLIFFASLALALPSPKDIESAVNAGNLSQAESMLREVIQEKPQSALRTGPSACPSSPLCGCPASHVKSKIN